MGVRRGGDTTLGGRSGMHHRRREVKQQSTARTISPDLRRLSYGWMCDGYLSFSTASVPRLGMLTLLHNGREAYQLAVPEGGRVERDGGG